jgi:hypothetical protein
MPASDMCSLRIPIKKKADVDKYIDLARFHDELCETTEIYGITIDGEGDTPHTLTVHFKGDPKITAADLMKMYRAHSAEKPKALKELLADVKDEKEKITIMEKFLLGRFGNQSLMKEDK